MIDARDVTLDPVSADDLTGRGLVYRTVDPADAEFEAYQFATDRGFLVSEVTDEQLAYARSALADRRLTGVFDPPVAEPVGTVASWVTELTTEPGRTTPMWAVSDVTVAPTHRRRGIARAMLTGELRAAADAGLALAGLTVTEATIYGRWGFSPAVYTADVSIDAPRAGWAGPTPAGRFDFLRREQAPALLASLHDRVRTGNPGQVEGWEDLWRRAAGLRPGDPDARKVRVVRWSDASGEPRGILVYTLVENPADYSRHELRIRTMIAETADAAAALWRFALEHDLVATVTAPLRTLDEPVRWMVADQRAITLRTTDHGWLRVLDVPAALAVRSFRVSVSFTLRVTDPLGIADGTWAVTIDDTGVATAAVQDAGAPVDLEMDCGAFASILLGGVDPRTLRAVDRIVCAPELADRLSLAFAPQAPLSLPFWY